MQSTYVLEQEHKCGTAAGKEGRGCRQVHQGVEACTPCGVMPQALNHPPLEGELLAAVATHQTLRVAQ